MKKILGLFHIHSFSTPIVSEYVSFHTRRIIYQCRCGCKEARSVSLPFGISFPIETTLFFESKDFKYLLGLKKKIQPINTSEEALKFLLANNNEEA